MMWWGKRPAPTALLLLKVKEQPSLNSCGRRGEGSRREMHGAAAAASIISTSATVNAGESEATWEELTNMLLTPSHVYALSRRHRH